MSLEGNFFIIAPTLPLEILDEIVTTAVRTLNPPSLSSIALVSNKYRILVNESRFSFIHLGSHMGRIEDSDCHRLDSLADLLRTGSVVDSMPSVANFITSLSLTAWGNTSELSPLLHNGALAYVFHKLFRQSAHSYSPRSEFRRVSLDILNWTQRLSSLPSDRESQGSISDDDEGQEEEESYEETFLEWSLTDSALTMSFINFLLNSQVTHLHLSHIHNIPLNFLLGTNLQHLSLGEVSFCEPDEAEAQHLMGPVVLRSADIGGLAWISFEIFVRLLCSESAPTQSTFGSMTEITFSLGRPRQLEMLKELLNHTVHLEYLCLCLFGSSSREDRESEDIDYTHLLCLKTIEIKTMDGGASFSLIAHLLGHHIPPNLDTIKISNNELHGNDTLTTASSSLRIYPFNILDKHLSHRTFNSIDSIIVCFSVQINTEYDPRTFDVDAYRKEYDNYVTSKFPLCMGKDPPVSISVPIVIEMVYGDGSIQL